MLIFSLQFQGVLEIKVQREKKGCVVRRSEGIPATVTELTERRRIIQPFFDKVLVVTFKVLDDCTKTVYS